MSITLKCDQCGDFFDCEQFREGYNEETGRWSCRPCAEQASYLEELLRQEHMKAERDRYEAHEQDRIRALDEMRLTERKR